MVITDNEIVESVRKGKKHLYARLVDRYKDKAMTLALRMLRNREDAEEALQDAFVRAYNALDRFEGKAKFGTWFYRILYNVCLTRLGRRKENFLSIDEQDREILFSYNPKDSSELNYEAAETVAIIKKGIETLPEKYSVVLSLFYFQELSHEEICEVTQLPLGTLKTHLFRARAMLSGILAKELEMEKILS